MDSEKEYTMHSKSDNTKCTCYTDVNEVANKLFESLCSRYQINLETSMKEKDFTFDLEQFFLYYKCHKVIFRRGGSYIDSPDWMKKKKTTINQ